MLGQALVDKAAGSIRHHGMFARPVPIPGSRGAKLQAQGLRKKEARESCQNSS